MSHQHHTGSDHKFKAALALNTLLTLLEFAAGFASGSLALLSDAGHNFTDSFSLLVAYAAERFGRRKADERHSFGHERITILAALFNAGILVSVALAIFYEAFKRMLHPEPVSGGIVTGMAAAGIIINGSIALIFSREKDLHLRSAFLAMAFDTLASVGALASGIIISLTGQTLADPIVSILIGIMLLFSTREIVHDSLHILLEGVPKGIRANAVKKLIRQMDHVKEVDDLHIWCLSSRDAALSCHVVVDECNLPKSVDIVGGVKKQLREKYGITHATIEIETIPCETICSKAS